ncbi:hypothetical protein H5410_056994 [Solanum commersonii]|uniref:Uncharacterized protein n=1 Tax=Solanum commersonii TaxID=4109 RepID=A0A9J5WNV1_SOLCO|nr:hypothetical protein H5410_056994 [Solanum commersonii]
MLIKRKKSVTTAPVSSSIAKGKGKEKEKKVVSCDVKKKQYPFEGFNIVSEGLTELMSSFSQWIDEGLYKHHAKKDKDDHYLVNCSKLGFNQLDFVVAFSKKKDCLYVMSQSNRCWTDEVNPCPLIRSRSNRVILNIDIPLLIIFLKTYIDKDNVVPKNENKIIDTIKGFTILPRLPWHLTNEIYVPERRIKVYDLMSSSRTNRKLCTEIQKLSTMLPKYPESSRLFEQKDRTNRSVLESYQGKNKSHPFEVIHVTGIAQQARNSL